jgi:CDP-glucose 4,6-dehydratase
MGLKAAFWRDKRVLLTGHTGFKGSWLTLWLQRLGARLTGYALPAATTPNLFELARVADGLQDVRGDVRDLDHLAAVCAQCAPEIVIHLAAQSLVRRGYQSPVETYATNVMGTVHLLEAVRLAGGVRVVIVVTSDKCYENREWVWGYRENEPMGGHDPYSSSKGCAELVTAAYRQSYFPPSDYAQHGLALASVRAGNVIGGGDWAADRLVPDALTAFSTGRTLSVRNPLAVRPWQHVLEPLAGYLLLAERLWEAGPRFAEGWNFGPRAEEARPVAWIVDRLAARWGPEARWEQAAGLHPHEAHSLRLDCSRARHLLGWEPRLSLDDALTWIVEWHQGYLRGQDLRALTEAQITRYEALDRPADLEGR